MRKVLVVAATRRELDAIGEIRIDGCALSFLVSGIGASATSYSLTLALSSQTFDVVMQVGIAGSYLPSCPIGSVVLVARDCFADFGADNRGLFIPASEMGFLTGDEVYTSEGRLVNSCPTALPEWAPFFQLPVIDAITVQTVSGSSALIERWQSLYHPAAETMEGASFFYVCLKHKIPFIALRAISNFVEPRNRNNWQIATALDSLKNALKPLENARFGVDSISDCVE